MSHRQFNVQKAITYNSTVPIYETTAGVNGCWFLSSYDGSHNWNLAFSRSTKAKNIAGGAQRKSCRLRSTRGPSGDATVDGISVGSRRCA